MATDGGREGPRGGAVHVYPVGRCGAGGLGRRRGEGRARRVRRCPAGPHDRFRGRGGRFVPAPHGAPQSRQAEHRPGARSAQRTSRCSSSWSGTSDVFLTNFLPRARSGSASMPRTSGPSTRTSSTCAAAGTANVAPRPIDPATTVRPSGRAWAAPGVLPRPIVGGCSASRRERSVTRWAGAMMAGGVAAALFARERTGEGSIVDVSLMGVGAWAMALWLGTAMLTGGATPPLADDGADAHRGEPDHRQLQDCRRALHHAHDAPTRSLLCRLVPARRPRAPARGRAIPDR